VNYHIASDPEVHVHRIGRTGRAGNTGLAFTLYRDSERYKIDRLGDYLGLVIKAEELPPEKLLDTSPVQPRMTTLQVDAGKKQKIRPGDILGALTGQHGIAGNQVGKINVFSDSSYVAVSRDSVSAALKMLGQGKLKGRSFKARRIEGQPTNSRRLARRKNSR